MQRTVLLIKPKQYKKLRLLAKKEQVSIAEINRRAIDQYLMITSKDIEALETLANQLEESNKRAEKALGKAEKVLTDTLKKLKESK